jgi:hypothetical protein
MSIIDSLAAQKLQSELLSGESIYWAGMPNRRVTFHSDDWGVIPFSLLWSGFWIFWEAGALGLWDNAPKSSANSDSTFMSLWGIPFLLFGQYMIWGRFVVDAWLKRRTYYAVTNRRVLILQEAWERKTNFVFLESIAELSRDGTSIGTLWLGPKLPTFGARSQRTRGFSRLWLSDSASVLVDIDNVDYVQRLILDLREKSPAPISSSP